MWTLYQELGYCINFTVSISSDPFAPIMSNAALRTGMRATFDDKTRQVLAGGKPWVDYKSTHDGNWFTNLF